MPTNLVRMTTVDQFMTGYTQMYNPIYGLFLANSQAYPEEVGKVETRTVTAVGDIRAKRILPKDTHIEQVAVMEGKKTFKKYFFANQFQMSDLQSSEGIDDVTTQVLDEHHVQMDELLLLGEGTSASNMVNNSLYWSNDTNYTLEASDAITTSSADASLLDLHSTIVTAATKANKLSGKKLIILYGTGILGFYNSLYSNVVRGFGAVLKEVLTDYDFLQLPSDITPAGANGFIIVNLQNIKLHYTTLPKLKDRGHNAEKMYVWTNFIMGSCMVEVKAKDGIIRQPLTIS